MTFEVHFMTSEVIDQRPARRQTALHEACCSASIQRCFVMTAYAVAHMRQATMGPEIVEYLHKIDGTLEPFGGRFLVHGGDVEVIENEWPGHLIIIEFPDRDHARDWYNSPAYQAILALRTGNSQADVVFVDGVEHPHKATDVLE
ncbi:conserved hypothetical protein [Mesorhizobium metallidurans STM 2683]|uniref:DUF1330 domain-containing protein n=2 Tax=Mesorhizobium metallidurans TaxID=489722 RepID=M5EJZ5_9HYPH|nr:conserved hypothetical protein [Mesorhizobium metallidurans STM 2683]